MERDKSIDIARGIGIVLVVLGHANMPHSTILFRFHMALFFIISGWCFSDKYLQSFKGVLDLFKKKIKGLYLPLVLFNSITLLLQNVFIRVNLYTDNPAFLEGTSIGNVFGITQQISFKDQIYRIVFDILCLGRGETQFGGATWFLRVLFGITVMWCAINWLLKTVAKFNEEMRLGINIILSIFLVIVAWQWIQEGRFFKVQFDTMASAYIMFCVGYYLKKYCPKMSKMQYGIIFIISMIILLYCDKICNQNFWDSSINSYTNPVMYIICSLTGFCVVFSLSRILNNIMLVHFIEVIGQHTLSILLFHFMSFKIVTLIQIWIYQEPLYRLASFPVYHSNNCWWFIYTMCGVLIPLCVAIYIQKIKEFCIRRIANIYKITSAKKP